MNTPVPTKKIHYAWVVCFGCALMFFCTCGLSCNVFSVYSPFIREKWNFTNKQISTIISTRAMFQMVAIFFTGRFYKKMNLRQGMLIAGLTCAVGYMIYGFAEMFPVYLLGSAFVGMGYGFGAMVPISMVLEHWFVRDRTLAVSLVSAASGLATVGIPSLITFIIERFGLRTAFFTEAAAIAVLVFCSYLIIRSNPGDLSISAFGEKEEKQNAVYRKAAAERRAQTDAQDGAVPAKRVLPKGWWFLLYFMVVISTSFNCAGYSHMSMLCTSEGFPESIMAIALSVAGAMLMVGKFVFGIMSSRIGLYKTSIIYGCGCVAATALCCVVRLGTVPMLLILGAFGFTLTMVSVGLVAWLEDWAQPEEYDKKVRIFQLLYSGGTLVTGLLPGIIADACGSYVPFYALSAGLCAVVVLIIWLTYRKVGIAK